MKNANEKRAARRAKGRKVDFTVLKGKRILLCEDHPLNRELMQHILRGEGMLVDGAENGKIGLDLFTAAPKGYYDAILMDIQMPVLNGLQAAKKIRGLARADAQKIPIIAVTAEVNPDMDAPMKESGIVEQLSKPVASQKLFEALAYHISETEKNAFNV